jgi:uncharacterized membrane protein
MRLVRTRRILAFLGVMLCAVMGIGLIIGTLHDRWAWFKAAMGVYMLGQAFRWFGFSRYLAGIRQRSGMSMGRAFKVMIATHVVAGGLVIVGALSSLERVFGLIVAYGAFCWIWLYGWFLMRLWKESLDPSPAP